MAKRVASLPSDRHVAWLCKVALYNASHNISSCVPEVELASDVEKILLRIRRGKEKPTPVISRKQKDSMRYNPNWAP